MSRSADCLTGTTSLHGRGLTQAGFKGISSVAAAAAGGWSAIPLPSVLSGSLREKEKEKGETERRAVGGGGDGGERRGEKSPATTAAPADDARLGVDRLRGHDGSGRYEVSRCKQLFFYHCDYFIDSVRYVCCPVVTGGT